MQLPSATDNIAYIVLVTLALREAVKNVFFYSRAINMAGRGAKGPAIKVKKSSDTAIKLEGGGVPFCCANALRLRLKIWKRLPSFIFFVCIIIRLYVYFSLIYT